ncbi:MAG: cobyrinate a,c-diamide synthase [Chloroflexi bacterium]|nr:cobyrinate a,c-diamide synthase [Chloroflexota bacterium]
MNTSRFVLAAPSSGSGKTTLATGLMSAFAERMTVQAYKVGPDYIDPGYHTTATGRPSRNLDTWMIPTERVKELFARGALGADICIIEGVMGLFDGYDGRTEMGSTAEVAKLLSAPVVLVIDAGSMARSAGAIALGFKTFDPQLNLAGVILNNVAGTAHAQWLTEAVQSVGLTVLGCVPRDQNLSVPERHLGLYMAGERSAATQKFIEAAKEVVRQNIDLLALETLARTAPEMEDGVRSPLTLGNVRIGIARDEAFCFYYEDNFDLLREAGAELVFFSPLHDSSLPSALSGLYLGGGYPELYAAQLAENESIRMALKSVIESGVPIYAECGGLMSLAESYFDEAGTEYPMMGVLSGSTRLTGKLKMGYREVVARESSPLLGKGQTARGHEFHYSEWLRPEESNSFAYSIQSRIGSEPMPEGFVKDNLLASYVHLHFASNPDLARNFVNACQPWRG